MHVRVVHTYTQKSKSPSLSGNKPRLSPNILVNALAPPV